MPRAAMAAAGVIGERAMGDWRSRNVENRRAPRSRVFYRALLSAQGEASEVKLLDVSSLGVQIESDVALSKEDQGVLIRGDLHLQCRVVWAMGRRAGLEFTGSADPQEIAEKLAPRRK